jgi:phosphoribosylformylglycinamidine synthase II
MILRLERVMKVGVGDPRAEAFRSGLLQRGVSHAAEWALRSMDLLWISVPTAWSAESIEKLKQASAEILLDPVLHEETMEPRLNGFVVEKRLLRGMTDNRARTLREGLALLAPELASTVEIRTGEAVAIGSAVAPVLVERLPQLLAPWWRNAVIQELDLLRDETPRSRQEPQRLQALFGAPAQEPGPESVKRIDLAALTDAELLDLSRSRLLALSLQEMRSIRDHFVKLGRPATDVELEVLAQTWSEHCRHKLFAAKIRYQSLDAADPAREIPAEVDGIFRQTIRATTTKHSKPWLLSVFSDNAGIVAFTPDDALCLKVETHNSPSALDPFGGAITGIVGVNRDILGCGLGAKPIANMDVFCVAPPDAVNPMPEKILDPVVLLEGIRAGVEAGGNQSGIPTVNGSVTFHASYFAKPLVYCGTLGWSPRRVAGRPCEEKRIDPGDRIVMLGGRIGRDGIHGATFSSLALTEEVPGSVVQLGDPITQKRMTDFLLEARDRGLYRALTDNGAGGLSSSIGEMATLSGGARMDVGLAPTKMPGLLPYERVISESQERMSVAVPPESWSTFAELARRREVEATDLGEFTREGSFEVLYRGVPVAKLDLAFLHDGVPRLELEAVWTPPAEIATREISYSSVEELRRSACLILRHPTVASKESMIRQYDHEVQGRSVVKPLSTRDRASSPNDAAVVAIDPERSPVAAVLSHGLAPLLGQIDPYFMGQLAVDEALRNAVAVGAEFSTTDSEALMALVDNFCWPDPSDSPEYAAALVRTAYGMKRACDEFRVPLISGKDSMKNDLRAEREGKPVRLSILPTLLMTALGRLGDLRYARTAEWKSAGDVLFLLGPDDTMSLAGSIHAEQGLGSGTGLAPKPNYDAARRLYEFLGSRSSKDLNAVHDCSEGGLLTALAESCFARNLGIQFDEARLPTAAEAFGEGFHRLVASCPQIRADSLIRELESSGVKWRRLGVLTAEPFLDWSGQKVSIAELRDAWSGAKERK